MKNKIKKIISLLIVLSLIASIGAFGIVSVHGEYEASEYQIPWLSSSKIVMTSASAFIQLYATVEKNTENTIGFYSATRLPIYGFESNVGGDINNVKKDSHESSIKGADGVYYNTWTTDLSYTPYQAYEVNVKGVHGDLILGYEGSDDGASKSLIMQIYDPSTGSYFDTCKQNSIQGFISLSCVVDAQTYAENDVLRFRVTTPTDETVKKIRMRYVSAGQINENIQYGVDKVKKSSGSVSANLKGDYTEDMSFCGKITCGDTTVYSMIYSFKSENVLQKQLCRFNMNFNGDASRNRNVTWSSAVKYEKAVVQMIPYGVMFPDFSNATEYTGEVVEFKEGEKRFEYYVNITDLKPGQEYWYRYGDGDTVWSDPCYLKTDDGDDHFAFIMGGDPQTQTEGIYDRLAKSINESQRIADTEFMVVCGDESDTGYLEFCWDWYLDANQDTFRTITLAPTMGNHDSWGWDWWIRMHNLTDPYDSQKRGSYYSFEYGNAHFSVINGNICKTNGREKELEAELEWLRNDLTNTDADFKFVISHQGMYSYPVHTYEAETVELRAILVPLFEECGVDMMLQGHDHVWLRSKQMKQGKVVNNTNTITDLVGGQSITYLVNPDGITYCNGGSLTGSKYHNPNDVPFRSLFEVDCAAQPNLQTFNIIEIDGGKLSFSGWAIDKDGSCRRISNYTTYPLGKQNDDGLNIIKTSYYDRVNNRILALPDDITMDNAEEIEALNAICAAETETIINNYVPDYNKLQTAVSDLDTLKKEESVPELKVEGTLAGEALTGEPVILPKVTAFDEKDGDVEVVLSVAPNEGYEMKDGEVVFKKAGTYTVTYTATDSDGHTTSKEFEISVALSAMLGDFDGDEEITVADALAALRIAAKLVDETPDALIIGDIDGDEHITVADALAILRVAAKLADEL